jgi:hypothetical protein
LPPPSDTKPRDESHTHDDADAEPVPLVVVCAGHDSHDDSDADALNDPAGHGPHDCVAASNTWPAAHTHDPPASTRSFTHEQFDTDTEPVPLVVAYSIGHGEHASRSKPALNDPAAHDTHDDDDDEKPAPGGHTHDPPDAASATSPPAHTHSDDDAAPVPPVLVSDGHDEHASSDALGLKAPTEHDTHVSSAASKPAPAAHTHDDSDDDHTNGLRHAHSDDDDAPALEVVWRASGQAEHDSSDAAALKVPAAHAEHTPDAASKPAPAGHTHDPLPPSISDDGQLQFDASHDPAADVDPDSTDSHAVAAVDEHHEPAGQAVHANDSLAALKLPAAHAAHPYTPVLAFSTFTEPAPHDAYDTPDTPALSCPPACSTFTDTPKPLPAGTSAAVVFCSQPLKLGDSDDSGTSAATCPPTSTDACDGPKCDPVTVTTSAPEPAREQPDVPCALGSASESAHPRTLAMAGAAYETSAALPDAPSDTSVTVAVASRPTPAGNTHDSADPLDTSCTPEHAEPPTDTDALAAEGRFAPSSVMRVPPDVGQPVVAFDDDDEPGQPHARHTCTKPDAHDTHDAWPDRPCVHVPAEHDPHDDDPLAANAFTPHAEHRADEFAPVAALAVPAGQSSHVVADAAPVALLNLPAAHDAHDDWPVSSANEPAGHAEQPVLPGDAANDPAEHATHDDDDDAPAPVPNLPASHATQLVWPAWSWNEPAEQSKQPDALPSLPAGQAEHTTPSGAMKPAGHGPHTDDDVAPVALLNDAGGQLSHHAWPVEFANEPAGHSEQPADPADDANDPAGHDTHADADDAFVALLLVPAGHSTHDDRPVAFANEPAAHTEQLVLPADDANEPSGHDTHVDDDVAATAALALPAGHKEHACEPCWSAKRPAAHAVHDDVSAVGA